MDDDSQDAKLLGSLLRYRSPTFSREEVKCLINLVEKYKSIILSKSINNAACHAKEMAWTKLTEVFNSQGLKHNRSTENLKGKWDNLKKEARKVTKNLMDVDHGDFDEIMSQTVNLLVEAENTCETKDFSDELKVLEEEEPKPQKKYSEKYWDANTEKDLNTSTEDAHIQRRFGIKRSINFSPQECSLLLNCVRPEKKYVFCKLTTSKANRLKNQAWLRITRSFNKISPQKRSVKILQTKFTNMKKLVKKETSSFFSNEKKYMKLDDNSNDKLIKSEPIFDLEDETEQDGDNDEGEDNDPMDSFIGLHSNNNSRQEAPDPLSTVLSSDSGFVPGFINNDSGKHNEDKEVTKLKTELLQYQLENAKLERERIEKAMRAEAIANETRAIESSLRLRAARLQAIEAAMKLPPSHPALQFTPEEARAQHYLNQYQT